MTKKMAIVRYIGKEKKEGNKRGGRNKLEGRELGKKRRRKKRKKTEEKKNKKKGGK